MSCTVKGKGRLSLISKETLIQFKITKDINIELKIYMIRNNLKDKRIAIIQILKEKFNLNNKTSEAFIQFINMQQVFRHRSSVL